MIYLQSSAWGARDTGGSEGVLFMALSYALKFHFLGDVTVDEMSVEVDRHLRRC